MRLEGRKTIVMVEALVRRDTRGQMRGSRGRRLKQGRHHDTDNGSRTHVIHGIDCLRIDCDLENVTMRRKANLRSAECASCLEFLEHGV